MNRNRAMVTEETEQVPSIENMSAIEGCLRMIDPMRIWEAIDIPVNVIRDAWHLHPSETVGRGAWVRILTEYYQHFWSKWISGSEVMPSDTAKQWVLSILLPDRNALCLPTEEMGYLERRSCINRLADTITEHEREQFTCQYVTFHLHGATDAYDLEAQQKLVDDYVNVYGKLLPMELLDHRIPLLLPISRLIECHLGLIRALRECNLLYSSGSSPNEFPVSRTGKDKRYRKRMCHE